MHILSITVIDMLCVIVAFKMDILRLVMKCMVSFMLGKSQGFSFCLFGNYLYSQGNFKSWKTILNKNIFFRISQCCNVEFAVQYFKNIYIYCSTHILRKSFKYYMMAIGLKRLKYFSKSCVKMLIQPHHACLIWRSDHSGKSNLDHRRHLT